MSDTRPATDEKTPEEIWRSMRYAMSDTRPATDEERIDRIRGAIGTRIPAISWDFLSQDVSWLLTRLAAAEEMCRDLQQSVDGMAHERLALETENAGLREALVECMSRCRWCRDFKPCSECNAARRLLEAKTK